MYFIGATCFDLLEGHRQAKYFFCQDIKGGVHKLQYNLCTPPFYALYIHKYIYPDDNLLRPKHVVSINTYTLSYVTC